MINVTEVITLATAALAGGAAGSCFHQIFINRSLSRRLARLEMLQFFSGTTPAEAMQQAQIQKGAPSAGGISTLQGNASGGGGGGSMTAYGGGALGQVVFVPFHQHTLSSPHKPIG